MTITLTPHAQELLEQQLANGGSPEQVIERALESLSKAEPPAGRKKKTPEEAVADIRELRKGLTLGGLKIKDLINEGRKY
ncbi:MAG TPA: hypothetical protein VKX25_17410 [Bryobacteraceae bacterium]|jgi:hypothetical protein|nr:hypothetical protein [Bryobacteraceae bacterium]